MKVRVRIAPSPTGNNLHIGNLYTALINWTFARQNKGKFIVRIEDTDKDRYVKGAEKKILQTLKDYGLDYDESLDKKGKFGPYRQSQRLEIYKKHALSLVDKGQAYFCTCSKERLDQVRKDQQQQKKVPQYDRFCLNKQTDVKKQIKTGKKYVIRLKVPKGREIVFEDLLRGKISFQSNDVDDQVLLKSDGYPTYHLAVVVDDNLMEISHVIRAEEWISSVPKHILLYDAFGWKKPIFSHVPLLRNSDKSKLSKRKNPVWASWYLEKGYLKEAVINYLCLMGWAHPQEKTIFPLAEFIKHFKLEKVSPAGPIFDLKKLDYINGVYIRNTDDEKLATLIKPFLKFKIEDKKLNKIIPLIKERIVTLSDASDLIDFFEKEIKYNKKLLLHKKAESRLVKEQLEAVYKELEKLTEWNLKNIAFSMQNLCEKNNWHRGQFFMALRVAVTCKTISPPLFESMEILGKEKTLQRIKIALKKLS
ncbi:glutamate--tRNA ligase [Patescibacteria group bacterium]